MNMSLSNLSTVERMRRSGVLSGHEGCVNVVKFSDNGDLLLSGCDNGDVKIWNPYTRQCLKTVYGHISNVFAGCFFPHSNSKFVSGSNDSDLRVCDIESGACTVYPHHRNKVMKVVVHPELPNSFFSCSFDGTVRHFDVREEYDSQITETVRSSNTQDVSPTEVLGQIYGGGRVGSLRQNYNSSLLINYRKQFKKACLYSIDIDPSNSSRIIAAGTVGDIRLFDLRMIRDKSPCSYANIYTCRINQSFETSGCEFSHNGDSIVGTMLEHYIFVWNTNLNCEQQMQIPFCNHLPRFRSACSSKYHYCQYDERYKKNLKAYPMSSTSKQKYKVSNTINNITHLASVMVGEDVDGSRRMLDYPKTYEQIYRGHVNSETIKGCYFMGPRSEYVVSGSDDFQIFIWNRKGKLVNRLHAAGIVNSIATHPSIPMMATSGFPDFIEIWEPYGAHLSDLEKLRNVQENCEIFKGTIVSNFYSNSIQCPLG